MDGTALKRIWWLVWPLAIAGVIAAGIWAARGVEVAAVKPTIGNAAEVVYATGTVEPRLWSKVTSLVRKRIVDICRCEGKAVTKGEVLAKLDDLEERAMLTELEARRNRLKEDADRLKGLVERNVSSRVTYDEKLTQVREYDARIMAQKDRLFDLELRAPMDGVVLRRDGEVGEITGTGINDVLFWVGQPKPLRITAEVNEDDIAKVKLGQTVLLRHEGFPGATMTATVDEVTPKGDPATKTFRAYFALPDDTPLKIGMSVEANVVVREAKGALLIPSDALRDGAVWIAADNRAKKVAVETGIRSARSLEVKSGLKADDQVITPYPAAISDGARVRVKAVGPK